MLSRERRSMVVHKALLRSPIAMLDPLPLRRLRRLRPGMTESAPASLHDALEPIIDEEVQLPPARLVVEHLHLAPAPAAFADEHVGRRLAFQAHEVAFADAGLDRGR